MTANEKRELQKEKKLVLKELTLSLAIRKEIGIAIRKCKWQLQALEHVLKNYK